MQAFIREAVGRPESGDDALLAEDARAMADEVHRAAQHGAQRRHRRMDGLTRTIGNGAMVAQAMQRVTKQGFLTTWSAVRDATTTLATWARCFVPRAVTVDPIDWDSVDAEEGTYSLAIQPPIE